MNHYKDNMIKMQFTQLISLCLKDGEKANWWINLLTCLDALYVAKFHEQ